MYSRCGVLRCAGARAFATLLALIGATAIAEELPSWNVRPVSIAATPDPALSPPVSPADPLSPEFLEAHDAVIRSIAIDNSNIFDPDDPAEDGLFYRLVNALHVPTRERVIRRQLLASPGDPFSAGTLAESERMLRSHRFLSEAEIRPVRYEDGFVDLEVRTLDTWSLRPSVSFSRKGGKNAGGFRIEEENLFGTGSALELGFTSGVERDSLLLAYRDPQLGSSRYRMAIAAADNSDGSDYTFELEQPFFSLDADRAYGFRVRGFDQTDSVYRLGEVSNQLQHDSGQAEIYYGFSQGLREGWTRRYTVGLGYDRHAYAPVEAYAPPVDRPIERRDVYPWVGVEWLEDRYEETRNADNIARIEDRHLGARLSARVGFASGALGSSDDAVLLMASASRGYHPLADDTLMLDGGFRARLGGSADGDLYLAEAGARYYHRQTDKRLFFAALHASSGQNLDTDGLLTLGGDTGLRAYPFAYQTGTHRALLTLEQRFYSDWYPWHLFHVGAAAFFDVGRAWGGSPDAGADLGTLRDVGVGLRIGSPHSATGRMLHIDLAYPLDGPDSLGGAQLVIETRKRF